MLLPLLSNLTVDSSLSCYKYPVKHHCASNSVFRTSFPPTFCPKHLFCFFSATII
ncbi:hypothetical protein HMPREF0239_01195 [Clostridium sp. ATCC BAA-442]|nr:hypothetical protein HMPREF0239_01195 [Clostridium sp. ATCC BAA-442]